MRSTFLVFLLSTVFLFTSCDKTTIEDFNDESLAEMVPAVKGKYIIYRLDSTVFTNFNRNIEIHKYQLKHQYDTVITDNMGRPSFRVFRFLRDSAGTQPWVENGTFYITHLDKQVEVSEDNLRFIRLHQPFKVGYTWKGNRYLTNEPYKTKFNFSNDDNMNDWDYSFIQYDETAMIGNQSVSNVYTILHIDESLNAPVVIDTAYGAKNFSQEKYAKNIGLVEKENIMWEWQPPANGLSGFYTGFGIKLWMIEHN